MSWNRASAGGFALQEMRAYGVVMSEVTYRIVEHDGGYAYQVGDVFSETFPSREDALQAAQAAAAEQQVPGSTEGIRYQDQGGRWHDETAQGGDRPTAKVVD